MALPNTITVNVGSPAHDIVFTDGGTVGDTKTYYAVSAQGDLEGRPSLSIQQTKTRQGIMRTAITITFPRYIAASGKYDGYVQDRRVLSRPDDSPLVSSSEILEALSEACLQAPIAAALVNGTL